MTGAQALIHMLEQERVEIIFGYPGGAIVPIYDALENRGVKLRHVLARHEQGAIHAAEGYARASGRPGICLVTSGPGATNIITGIADALMDSVPLICITGQVNSQFLGCNVFQEVDVMSITAPITKWNVQITSANQIPDCLSKAFYIAQSGRPGPVLIDITRNAQVETFEFQYTHYIEKKKRVLEPDLEAIKRAAEILNQASRPYLLIGHGVLISGAEKELKALAEKGGIPVASTLLGLSSFPTDHPLYVGMLGMHGNYGPNILTNKADVILAVGMRFDDRVTGALEGYAKQAKIIHIDIDPAELNSRVQATVPILADAKRALQALLLYISSNSHDNWLKQFKECHRIENEKVIHHDLYPEKNDITMGEAIHHLNELEKVDPILVTDVGQHQMITARYYSFKTTQSHITSGGLGTMGYALPAAIGAKLAQSARDVIAVIGDGGFQMTLQELGVVSQEKLPIKILILNNGHLGLIGQWQSHSYENMRMKNPDFVKIAESYGIQARRVEVRAELKEALRAMLESKDAYLLEIIVKNEIHLLPMIPSGGAVDEDTFVAPKLKSKDT